MTQTKNVKSLAMRKMEKNFIAVNQKRKTRYPYRDNTLQFLIVRLFQEFKELNEAVQAGDFENAMDECADVSNITDYVFEALQNPQIKTETVGEDKKL
jgi:NTP pyrophosphatase (non-canonical NTP hydrolase)